MTFPGVMLASPTSVIARTNEAAIDLLAGREGWVHEFKADGVRAVADLTGPDPVLYGRTGSVITDRYPDVVQTLRECPVSGVFDGEIVCVVDGRVDFPAIHRRDAQSKPRRIAELARLTPASLLAFDVLQIDGEDMTRERLSARRRVLTNYSGLTLMPQTDDLRALWSVVQTQDFEGVVSKRSDSRYTPKRSRDWVKIKQTKTVSCVVTAFEAGRGGRGDTFGALEVSLFKDGQLTRVGSVGSGFTQKDLEVLAAGEAGFVIEVAYLDVSPNNMLRQPVYLHTRPDLTVADCTFDQLRLRH